METNIKCPKCNHSFDVQDIILNSVQKGVSEKLKSEKTLIEKKLRAQFEIEKSDEIASYKEQLDQKIKETKSHNKLKAEFERLQREKSELQEEIEAKMEQKLSAILKVEKVKIGIELDSKVQLKLAERDHVISQLNEQLKIAQRKAEQGSNQIQGEVQEIAIEDFLKSNFPMDTILEVKKGVRGADCLHKIMNSFNTECGSIYYESKRTKDFQKSWIEKFKKDMQGTKAMFGVIVTDVYPKDVTRLTQINGVYICSLEEFKGLCLVLRESVLLMHNATIAQENSGTKMELLYQFLTGSEFRSHIEVIVEGFSKMNEDLSAEKRAMEAIWKKREKQINNVLNNTSQMYGSIRGIAGNAIGTVDALELTGKG